MSLIALWTPENTSLYSSIFNVPAEQVCILYAANLEQWAYRADAASIKSAQAVCIRRLLFDYAPPTETQKDSCGWVFAVDSIHSEKIMDTVVQTCGLPWQLTMCRNIGIIGLPGSYRLELNDSTAIGTAQVYAECYKASVIPPQVQNLFF